MLGCLVARARALRGDPLFEETLRRARQLEPQLVFDAVSVSAAVKVDTARVATAAGGLADFELELRRALALVLADVSVEPPLPPFRTAAGPDAPVPPAEGGLAIEEAESGSPLDVLLATYGVAQEVLLWNPLQVALTLRALIGDAVHLRFFRRRQLADGTIAVEDLNPGLAAQIDALVGSLQPGEAESRLRGLYAEFETTQADGSSLVTQIGLRREPPPPSSRRQTRRHPR